MIRIELMRQIKVFYGGNVMDDVINKQRQLADELLSKIEAIDPYCIVAGGAPRDWYLGNPATDIDIFIYSPENRTQGAVTKQFSRLGLKVARTRDGGSLPENYKNNTHLRWVLDIEGTEFPVQIMVMSKPTQQSVVDHFPLSICKVWYKHGSIRGEPEFLYSIECKIIFKTSELYGDGSRYIQKIKNKFPDYRYFESFGYFVNDLSAGEY